MIVMWSMDIALHGNVEACWLVALLSLELALDEYVDFFFLVLCSMHNL